MYSLNFTKPELVAELTARMLFEIEAVHFMTEKPFIFTSGKASPVYIDCRKIISFPRVRSTLMDFGAAKLAQDIGFEQFDAVAGGETAGIPFAAFIAERLNLPMQYVRKKSKGFGRDARIEGDIKKGQRILLVEDLTTDGGSKLSFAEAIRDAGAEVKHTFVVFYYDIFKDSMKKLNDNDLRLHYLATWWDVLNYAKKTGKFDKKTLFSVEDYLNNPIDWSNNNGGK
jgi:orotate phosphoribosyltransferase